MKATAVHAHGSRDLETWRQVVRNLLSKHISPADIEWHDPDTDAALFSETASVVHAAATPLGTPVVKVLRQRSTRGMPMASAAPTRVAPGFIALAQRVLFHHDPARWNILYTCAFRLMILRQTGLLRNSVDPDVRKLELWAKAIRRDAHKMKAFVRFRRTDSPATENDAVIIPDYYVAWYKPQYRIVRLVAPFFARRFGVLRWSILTPNESAHWNGQKLVFGPGATQREAVRGDPMEELWKTYYANIFNPARINPAAMQREMPKRFWALLPEAELIDELLRKAPKQLGSMIEASPRVERSALDYIPEDIRRQTRTEGVTPESSADARSVSLRVLAAAATSCQGCDLYRRATCTVFGAGPIDAPLMLIGEQPGDQEDREGFAFVGPAGEVLDDALLKAGISRGTIYITNAVKHFKWTPQERGKRRIHAKPGVAEARACRPWLEHEVWLVRPKLIIALGATAAHSLLGSGFRVAKDRGKINMSGDLLGLTRPVIATFHPSAILRATDGQIREELFSHLVEDLRRGWEIASQVNS